MNENVRYIAMVQRINVRALSRFLESAIRWRNIAKTMTPNSQYHKLARRNMRSAALNYNFYFHQL